MQRGPHCPPQQQNFHPPQPQKCPGFCGTTMLQAPAQHFSTHPIITRALAAFQYNNRCLCGSSGRCSRVPQGRPSAGRAMLIYLALAAGFMRSECYVVHEYYVVLCSTRICSTRMCYVLHSRFAQIQSGSAESSCRGTPTAGTGFPSMRRYRESTGFVCC